MNKLFEIEPTPPKAPDNFCRNCVFMYQLKTSFKSFYYCNLLKSKRTSNGKLKIKYTQAGCLSFKKNQTAL